jgi:hypothetical protein
MSNWAASLGPTWQTLSHSQILAVTKLRGRPARKLAARCFSRRSELLLFVWTAILLAKTQVYELSDARFEFLPKLELVTNAQT